MRTKIENALAQLIGLPLWGAGRVVEMEWFQLGEHRNLTNYDGSYKTAGAWALHIFCAWRIRDPKRIIVASSNCYIGAERVENSDETFDWDVRGANQRDQRTIQFMQDKQDSLIVTGIVADDVGGFCLKLAPNFSLEAFPNSPAVDFECWRLFQPATQSPHFVVTTSGIET